VYVIKLYTFFCGVAREYIGGPSCDGHVGTSSSSSSSSSSSNNNNNNNNNNNSNSNQQNQSMEWSPECEKDVADSLRTTLNWKAPGRDQITNFWLKQLTATHKLIAALYNKFIEEDRIPKWLTAGVTFLIPKNGNTENPNNYRPVTCLPTIYRLMTSVISRRMQNIWMMKI